MSQSIADAINAANTTIVAEENKVEATNIEAPKVEAPENKEPEKVDESEPVAPEPEEDEVKLDKRTSDALRILDILEDPKEAKGFILELAQRAGVINAESTKAEVKQAVKSVAEVLKEKLGDNYEFLSGPIGDALTDILGQQRAEFQAELQKRDQELWQANFAKEYTQVTTDLKITEGEAVKLNTLCQKYPNYGTVPLSEYLGTMLKLVRVEQSQTLEKKKTVEKQSKNLSERLPKGTEVVEARQITADAKGHMTPKEAIMLAMRNMQQE